MFRFAQPILLAALLLPFPGAKTSTAAEPAQPPAETLLDKTGVRGGLIATGLNGGALYLTHQDGTVQCMRP